MQTVCACEGSDSREEKMFTTFRERQEERIDGMGKDEARRHGCDREKKKTKQNDEIVYVQRSTQIEARTLIGAPKENEGRTDQIIRRDSCPPYPERTPFGSATFWGGGRRRG